MKYLLSLLLALCLLLTGCGPAKPLLPDVPAEEETQTPPIFFTQGELRNIKPYSLAADHIISKLSTSGRCISSYAGGIYGEYQKLSYIDYDTATCRAVCALPGCAHADERCEAWLPTGDFTPWTAACLDDFIIFVRNGCWRDLDDPSKINHPAEIIVCRTDGSDRRTVVQYAGRPYAQSYIFS